MRNMALGRLLPPAAIAFVLCLGCNASTPQPEKAAGDAASHDDHDHEGHDHEQGEHADHPKTYAEAVAKVEALETEMREALAKGETKKADLALHEVGHVLEDVAQLAKEASFSTAQQLDVKKDVDELFEHFGTIDDRIHGDLEVSYDEFAEKIHAAVERLHERVEK